jgi:hypothetical protein
MKRAPPHGAPAMKLEVVDAVATALAWFFAPRRPAARKSI